MKFQNLTLCDHIRVEDNGKFLLIGVYTNTILFQQLPAQFHLSIWMLIEHEQTGPSSFSLRGRMPEADADLFEISADAHIEKTDEWTPFGVTAPLLIGQPGTLVIEAMTNGGDWFELRKIHIKKGVPSRLVPQAGTTPKGTVAK
jgi:hypothetical protein